MTYHTLKFKTISNFIIPSKLDWTVDALMSTDYIKWISEDNVRKEMLTIGYEDYMLQDNIKEQFCAMCVNLLSNLVC